MNWGNIAGAAFGGLGTLYKRYKPPTRGMAFPLGEGLYQQNRVPYNRPNYQPVQQQEQSQGYQPSSGGGGGGYVPQSRNPQMEKFDYDDYMHDQEDAMQEAMEKQASAMKKAARRSYESGNSQVENLLSLLAQSYDAGKGRLDTSLNESKEDFEKEKADDINRLRAFYASAGIGDSEQAGQGYERTGSVWTDRFGDLQTDYGNNLKDLEMQRSKVETDYRNRQLALKEAYENAVSQADDFKFEAAERIASTMSQYLKDMMDYNLQEGKINAAAAKSKTKSFQPVKASRYYDKESGQVRPGYYDPNTGTMQWLSDEEYKQILLEGKYPELLGGDQGSGDEEESILSGF